jgi:hypothetical protein
MQYTLSSGGVALGHTALELPIGAPQTLVGFFHPTDAFAIVGAPLLALAEQFASLSAGMRDAMPPKAELAAVPPEERALRIRAALQANPSAQALARLHTAVSALALEVRDEQGAVVPTSGVLIAPFPLALSLPLGVAPDDLRSMFAESGVAGADFMIAITRARPQNGAA